MNALTIERINGVAESLADKLLHYNSPSSVRTFYGVPRGGVPAAYALAHAANRKVYAARFSLVNSPEQADVIVDDLVDSGKTRERFAQYRKPFAALFTKREALDVEQNYLLYGDSLPNNEWVRFPWEEDKSEGADDIFTRLLQFMGEDPQRGGLIETPTRAARAWRDWTSGYKVNPAEVLKSFEDGATGYNQMVLVKDIPVYSHCEHHLAPFFGVAHVAYIPERSIVGLSKVSRLVDIFARRLQVQERMTTQIADALDEALAPRGVAVMIQCRHMCMESRGVNRRNLVTVTTALRGCMSSGQARDEFLTTINSKGAV